MDQTAIEIVLKFREAFPKQGLHIEKIVLLGSYAGSIPHEGSDIDVAVISRSFEGKDLWKPAT